jgi:hypothetical protein
LSSCGRTCTRTGRLPSLLPLSPLSTHLFRALRKNLTDPLVLLGFDEKRGSGTPVSRRWLNRPGANADGHLIGLQPPFEWQGYAGRSALGRAVELPCSFGPRRAPSPHRFHEHQKSRGPPREPFKLGRIHNLHRIKDFRTVEAPSIPGEVWPQRARFRLRPFAGPLAADRPQSGNRADLSRRPETLEPAPIGHFVEFSLRALFSFGPQSARARGEVIHVDPIDRSSSVVPTGRRGLGIFPLAPVALARPLTCPGVSQWNIGLIRKGPKAKPWRLGPAHASFSAAARTTLGGRRPRAWASL